jgi:hypothetical protein
MEGDENLKQVKKTSPFSTSPETRARSNIEIASALAEHLAFFSCNPLKINLPTSRDPYQFEPPINCVKGTEVEEVISSLNPKKSSGYDLITGKILKELPILGIKYLTQLFNAVLIKRYFLAPWKVAQIILISKFLTSEHATSQ